MFRFLNRCLHGIVWLLLAGAVWLVWSNRELGLPLVDLYVAWDKAGFHSPAPLSRNPGTVGRIISENIVEFRDQEGRAWNVGLQALSGVDSNGRDPMRKQFALATRTNLAELLVGRRVEMAWVSTNSNRTGMGFVYVDKHPQTVAIELVRDGRLRFLEEDARNLPLLEQMRLRGADRKARNEQRGLWARDLGLAKEKSGS
ncbi:MAG TPA: thermonuclease family protein [Verrucomicrobiota bacterium]|nr:hypothetical protein [Verrucomicrobiales bacterium]HRI14611.1 thermonuclease family protein [Verrucomicrobiota bacterium]